MYPFKNCIRRPTLLDNYVYLHESDFNIGQFNDLNSFDEAISSSDSDNWVTAMQEALSICKKMMCGIL